MRILSVDVDSRLPSDFSIHLINGRSDYLFVLFNSPTMLFADNKYVKVDKGTGIFFDKNKIQSYYACGEEEFNHDFIMFGFDNEYEKILYSEIPMGVPVHFPIPDIISDALAEIKKESIGMSKYKNNILSNAGMIFLYKVLNELTMTNMGNKKSDSYKDLYKLRMEIYQHPEFKWSVEEMCRKTCLSRYYLQHLYKDFFGISCIKDVIYSRISHAKVLLQNSDIRISEIGEMCGYKNTEHFIRQFKEITFLPPERYRVEKRER